jgi:hypothetical protein
MTFILRDDNKAFRLNPNAIYDVQFDESKPAHFVTMDDERISPYFDVLEPNETREEFTDEEYADILSTAEYDAVEWLCDFLERLELNPAVMHCVSDGEIWLHPEKLMRSI